jgi:ferredoxin--NADP+ reductase
MSEWVQGTVVENIRWTQNLFSLRINAPVDDFTAGQFTSLGLDIEGERIARPYSFLSAPGQQPIEFFFYTATDGVLSNTMVALEAGDAIFVKREANGFFTLDEVPSSKTLWLLGTGTGVAPYFSMLKTDEPWQRFERVVLVHAVRQQSDLRYQGLIDELAQEYGERFVFQAFVSRENVAGALEGRIPDAINNGELERSTGIEIKAEYSQLMLCGNPEMVADTTTALKARGLSKNRRRTPGQITVEKYW